jgi:hypothetical protein
MSDEEWKSIIEAALDYLPNRKRSRACSAATSATLIDEDMMEDPEEDFIMPV